MIGSSPAALSLCRYVRNGKTRLKVATSANFRDTRQRTTEASCVFVIAATSVATFFLMNEYWSLSSSGSERGSLSACTSVKAAPLHAEATTVTRHTTLHGAPLSIYLLHYIHTLQRAICEPLHPHYHHHRHQHHHYADMMDPAFADDDDDSGYTEEERFLQCLDYHRSLLHDYVRRWGAPTPSLSSATTTAEKEANSIHGNIRCLSSGQKWPRSIPMSQEISALVCDLVYCERNTFASNTPSDYVSNQSGDRRTYSNDTQSRICQDAKFRIASYYLSSDVEHSVPIVVQRRGYKMIKELAEIGHPDGMCYYGKLLNEGHIAGDEECRPHEAVSWWWKCVEDHRHIQATYELATAYYLGEFGANGGIPENMNLAVHLFRRAANLGHAGAAYMLGECLLYGSIEDGGVERDRANALEWLVTAAELGHRVARERIVLLLTNEHYGGKEITLDTADDNRKQEEGIKWMNLLDDEVKQLKAVNIERRYTIGGDTRNPLELEKRRKTVVSESRDED